MKNTFLLLFQLFTLILSYRWLYCLDIYREKLEKADLLLLQLITFILSHRWLYWSDYITEKIEKARLDGSERQPLVTTGLRYPYGLALDQQSKWINMLLKQIQKDNLVDR